MKNEEKIRELEEIRKRLFAIANSYGGDITGHIAVVLHESCNNILEALSLLPPPCSECKGSGKVPNPEYYGRGKEIYHDKYIPCPACQPAGLEVGEPEKADIVVDLSGGRLLIAKLRAKITAQAKRLEGEKFDHKTYKSLMAQRDKQIEQLERQLKEGHHCASFEMCEDAGEAYEKRIKQLEGEVDNVREALLVLKRLRVLYQSLPDMLTEPVQSAAKLMIKQAEEGIALAEKRWQQEYITKLQAQVERLEGITHGDSAIAIIEELEGENGQWKERYIEAVNDMKKLKRKLKNCVCPSCGFGFDFDQALKGE